MATRLDKEPDQKSENKSQQHYDKQFNELTSPEHMSKDGNEFDLYERENNPDTGEPLEPEEQAKLDQIEADLKNGHVYEKDTEVKLNPNIKVKKKWKRLAIGTGLFGLFGGTVAIIFFFLPTLRVAHLVNNLEGRFMGIAGSAIEQRAERLFSRYVRNRVFPIAQRCGNIVTPDCDTPFDPGQGYAGRLYTDWSNSRIEQKLFTDRGMRVEYNQGTRKYTIFRANGSGVDFNGPDFELSDFDGQDVSRNDLRREIRRALKEVSLWDRVMLRGPVRRLAKTKWNIRWCFFACDTRDDIRESTFNTTQKLKLKMIERTIAPFSDRLAVYFTCAVSDCNHTEYLRERSSTLANAVESLEPGDLDRITNDLQSNNRQLSRVLVEKVLTRIFNETTGRAGAASIPIIGWIYAIDAVNEIDKKLYEGAVTEFIADNTASQYAEFFLNFRVHHDEAIDGQLALDEVGAQSQIFDGLEGSLVYQREFGNGTVNREALNEKYACADEEPIPEGELVCEERKVGRLSGYDSWRQSEAAIALSNTFLGTYRCGVFDHLLHLHDPNFCSPGSREDTDYKVDDAIHFVFSKVGFILEAIGTVVVGALRLIPGFNVIFDWFTEQLGNIVQLVLELVFPFIQAGAGPGNQVFDDFYAGADVVGNDFAKGLEDPSSGELHGLGGRKLSDAEVQDNLTFIDERNSEDFQHKPLYARLFSTNELNSLVSRAAGIAPIGTTLAEVPRTLLSYLNPFSILSGVGDALAYPVYAQGEYQYQGDPFGIDQYGFAVNDPIFDMNPDDISDASCIPGGELYEEWKEGIIGDDPGEQTLNGQVQYTEPNPCMLELTTINVLSSWFTDENDGGIQ